MKKYSKLFVSILAIAIIAIAGLVLTSNASATTLAEGASAARCEGCPENLFGETGVFHQITSTIIYIIGVIAVIMLIWGGLRYVLSGGDAKKVTDAKNTVLYAIIGLIVAFLSYAVVLFVIDTLPSSENRAVEEQQTEQVEQTNQ